MNSQCQMLVRTPFLTLVRVWLTARCCRRADRRVDSHPNRKNATNERRLQQLAWVFGQWLAYITPRTEVLSGNCSRIIVSAPPFSFWHDLGHTNELWTLTALWCNHSERGRVPVYWSTAIHSHRYFAGPWRIVGAGKSGVSRHLKSGLEARTAKVNTELEKLPSCEMRGGADVRDKLVLVLLGVIWLVNLSACQIG